MTFMTTAGLLARIFEKVVCLFEIQNRINYLIQETEASACGKRLWFAIIPILFGFDLCLWMSLSRHNDPHFSILLDAWRWDEDWRVFRRISWHEERSYRWRSIRIKRDLSQTWPLVSIHVPRERPYSGRDYDFFRGYQRFSCADLCT
jgi:hypothetical protein